MVWWVIKTTALSFRVRSYCIQSNKLDLSGHHEKAVLEYLKFTRLRRNQCVRSVASTFQETMDSRLNEGTFTAEEVKEMMSGNKIF